MAGIERERWTREMEAVGENYEPVHKDAGTLVYQPRPGDGVP